MAHMAPFAESDFDSIHSSQAFVGDHQVMYTPPLRARKPSRFASNQSYILPDIPNTSQIVGAGAGELPRMRPSANENQIVIVLTRMQKQLDQAKTTIRELVRERDEYRDECKALRQLLVQTKRATSQVGRGNRASEHIDNDLFDLTQYSEQDDDFTQQLPTLNVRKSNSGLKVGQSGAQTSRSKKDNRPISKNFPASQPQTEQRQSTNVQQTRPTETKRAPLVEISEGQYKQRSQTSPQKAIKKVVIEEDYPKEMDQSHTSVQMNARHPTRNLTYLSNIPDNQPFTALRNQLEAERLNRQYSTSREPKVNEGQESARSTRAATAPPPQREAIPIMEDLTAASNTSRRRRRASDTAEIDDNMTSAYIIPDITVAKPQQRLAEAGISDEKPQSGQLSEEAKDFLHSVDPDHIVSCVHCRRLLRLPEKLQVRRQAAGWDWCMTLADR